MTRLAVIQSVAAPIVGLVLSPLVLSPPPIGLDAYVELRRSVEAAEPSRREGLERRADTARRALLAAARESSRLLVTVDRRGGPEARSALGTARLVARDGRVTLQALGGPHPRSPHWERAGLVDESAYLETLDRLLRDPALLDDWPVPRFDPNAPGPRRAVTLRLAIGGDEREMQAMDGPRFERLASIADALLRFCRTVPLAPVR
jgi:hypothetical protein